MIRYLIFDIQARSECSPEVTNAFVSGLRRSELAPQRRNGYLAMMAASRSRVQLRLLEDRPPS